MKVPWDSEAQPARFWTRKQQTYGLSREAFLILFRQQEGKCYICRKVFRSSPHVDHDHQTAEVRGLLDYRCNRGLGFFDERADFLARAVAYLHRIPYSQAPRGT